MHPLPTDRTGWVVLLSAGVNWVAHALLLALIAIYRPGVLSLMWRDVAVFNLPAILIVVAAGLSYQRRSPARYTVVVAGLLAAVGEVCGLDFWFGRPLASVVGPEAVVAVHNRLAIIPWSYLIALAALVPAAVGRWQRRQDRLDDDSDA